MEFNRRISDLGPANITVRHTVRRTFPFLPMLALVFITLKLLGVINWSWLWVTAPLWGMAALPIAIAILWMATATVFLGIVALALWLYGLFLDRKEKARRR